MKTSLKNKKLLNYHSYPEVSLLVFNQNNTKKKIENNLIKLEKLLKKRNSYHKKIVIENAIFELELKRKYIGLNEFFPTNIDVFDEIFNCYANYKNCIFSNTIKILDPCAGFGSMLDHLIKYWVNIELFAIEINRDFHPLLKRKGYHILGEDLFEIEKLNFDFIFINSPFELQSKVIRYSFDNFLNIDGDLLAITSSNFLLKDKDFSNWLDKNKNYFYGFLDNKNNFYDTKIKTSTLWLNKS